MSKIVLTIWAVLVLGAGGVVAYLYLDKRTNEANERERQEWKRNRADPAFCSLVPVSGVEGVCWLENAACIRHNVQCEAVTAYACFRATAMTTKDRIEFCLRTYGGCVQVRDGILRDAEYTEVSECLVYRTSPAR